MQVFFRIKRQPSMLLMDGQVKHLGCQVCLKDNIAILRA
jgi:hypothetical protein